MSNKKNMAMKYSRHVHHFSFYPKTKNESGWVENINREIKAHDIDVIMPVFENGIRTLIKHKDLLIDPKKLVDLPTITSFNVAINKWNLSEYLRGNDILGPKSVLIKSSFTHFNNSELLNIKFPVIIKPNEGYGGGQGVTVFNTIDELNDYLSTNNITYDAILQEYIDGDDMGCNVLCKEGEILAFTMQRGIMWNKNIFAPQIGHEFLIDTTLYIQIEHLVKALNWSGVACVDLRYSPMENRFYIIEINTRYWRSLLGSLIAGLNFPYLYTLSSLNLEFPNYEFKHITYLNLKGLIKRIRINPLFVFDLNFIWNNTPLKFALLDPLPMMYKFVLRQKNLVKKWFK